MKGVTWSFIQFERDCSVHSSRITVRFDEESKCIVMHISEINIDDIRDLDIDNIENIVQRTSLRIPNKDWHLKYSFELGSGKALIIRCVIGLCKIRKNF
jgi:hypothetical protein